MFCPLPTPLEMAQWDRASVEMGLPECLLMENASREALRALNESYGSLKGKRVLLFMGSGNNGGDAACLARHIVDAGAKVLVLHSRPLAAYKGVTGQHLRIARKCGVPFRLAATWPTRYVQSPWMYPDVVVDGLLGTGFTGQVRPYERELIQHINTLGQRAFVFALDIPSGLSGFYGRPSPVAVRANTTVTFEAPKLGLMLPEATPWVGRLRVCPIGIPSLVREQHPASFQLMVPEFVTTLPQPTGQWHKGKAGHVLIVGGSAGLTGAPHLAALGALSAGAGLVTIAAPAGLLDAIQGHCPDIMGTALHSATNAFPCQWDESMVNELLPLVQRVSALVLGPGMGRDARTAAFINTLLTVRERPVTVIDADAIHALSTLPANALPTRLRPHDILTPHPGEAGFLLHKSVVDIQTDRFASLRQLMNLAPNVWLLKGAGTLVGTIGRPIALSPHAEANLAVGGSGDVLAGCLGSLAGQNSDSFAATCAATLIHAQAGNILNQQFPLRGNSASSIAHTLPEARALFHQKQIVTL